VTVAAPDQPGRIELDRNQDLAAPAFDPTGAVRCIPDVAGCNLNRAVGQPHRDGPHQAQ